MNTSLDYDLTTDSGPARQPPVHDAGPAARLPQTDVNPRFDPWLASLGWYLGRSVFRETYWLREMLSGDSDLTDRVRPLFASEVMGLDERCARLPPPHHLLGWASEIQDENLRRLATAGGLPASQMLEHDRLQAFLLQESARDYERMLMVLHAGQLQEPESSYSVENALTPSVPASDLVEVSQGHYRIGSRFESFAYDNELPPRGRRAVGIPHCQATGDQCRVSGLHEVGGLSPRWALAGERQRMAQRGAGLRPLHWRLDRAGRWYGIGLKEPADLPPEEPVAGVSWHEAQAFANWTAELAGDLSGAVLQHEYQWEVAARLGFIEGAGRVWEWCANSFHPYAGFSPSPGGSASQVDFDKDRRSLRGASLHTQRCLRRASFRNRAASGDRCGFSGIRLVFPPV